MQHSHQRTAIAGLLLACSAACYAVAFARLEHGGARRNFYTYSTFGLLIALAGSLILFSGMAAAAFWWTLALGAVWAGGFFGRVTMQLHGLVYLLVGLFVSGGLAHAGRDLLTLAPPAFELSLCAAALVALIFDALILIYPASRDGWLSQGLRVLSTGAVVFVAAGIFACALTSAYNAFRGQGTGDAYAASLRTSVLACASLVLAWAGSRWGKREFSRLIYPFMALGAYRMMTQDFNQGKAVLFFSLLVYGGALMLLPRLSRQRVNAA